MAASINVTNNGVYRGPPVVSSGSVPKVAACDIKSGPGIGTAVGSEGHAKNVLLLSKDAKGNPVWKNVTANNSYTSYDVSANGYFSPQMDDGVIRNGIQFRPIAYWLANGNENPPARNNVMPRIYDLTNGQTDSLLHVEGITPESMRMPNRHDTSPNLYTTQDMVAAYDMNARGRLASQVEEFRQKIKTGVLHNDANQLHYEIVRWYEFLDSKGVHPNESPIHAIGVGNIGGLAGYNDEIKSLSADLNFYERAKAWIERFGLTDREKVQAMERAVILHEISHAFGIDGDRKGEQLQGRLWAEFYSTLAKEFEGSKWQTIYNTLSEVGKDYAESYSFFNYMKWQGEHEKSRRQTTTFNILVNKYQIEGEEQGLEGKALEKYVESRIKNTFRGVPIDESDSLDSRVENAAAEIRNAAQNNNGSDGKSAYITRGTNYKSDSTESEGSQPQKTYNGRVVSLSEYKQRREAGRETKASSKPDAKSESHAEEAAQAKEAPQEGASEAEAEGPAAEAA